MGNYSKPIKEIVDRLTFHVGAGQLLAGSTFFDKPMVKIEGQQSYPVLELRIPTVSESYRPSRLAIPKMQFELTVATERAKGLEDHMKTVEKVLDALEVDITGKINPNLNGTTRPFEAAVTANFALDLSLNSVISLTIEPSYAERGKRRL